ncbi:WD40 repeat-like protein [Suhomyces tanzawaensis NRRL Y-17324]|uniref:WD40 repeat-like protein n=1 Tax=Suhomyces tanzawaensis NRRL Y-17324 TaxID=984487 RepID=A0A1E4SRI1_9ASCO|nr:WD40 repeat-like protein [Suhomyces tanzawaensis NRRL Y-17324]ODV82119.1 WD40 repeat-like protein [Suhomyces tanzawaensis NRRL Y-17324]
MPHLVHPHSSINSACFVPHTSFLLTGGGNDFELKLHDLSPQSPTSTTFSKAHANSVNAVHTLPHTEVVVSASNDTIVLHDLREQTVIRSLIATSIADVDGLSTPREQVLDCKMLNRDMVASCGVNHHLNLYDLRQKSKRPVYNLSLGDDNLNSLDYNHAHTITVGSSNGSLYSLDVRKECVVTDTFPHASSIIHVACYGSATRLVSSVDGHISLYDAQSEALNVEISVPGDSTLRYKRNAQFVESHNVVLCGSEDGHIWIWDLVHGYAHRNRKRFVVDSPVAEGRLVTWTGFDSAANKLVGTTANGYLWVWDRAM